MIDYLEIRQKSDREIIGILDTAQSVIWHSTYNGVGDFEIYAETTESNLSMLVVGNYVTRPNNYEIGVIESVEINTDVSDGTMITASGRFAKSILDRRHIYNILQDKTVKATVLSGNVEVQMRTLVTNHLIAPSDTNRTISFFELGELANIPQIIVDSSGNATRKQVSYENLLTYTDSVLEEYGLSACVKLNDTTLNFQYCVFVGTDRSVDNTSNNDPVIFSVDFDNLLSSDYSKNDTEYKNSAIIGGEGEGTERFYSVLAGTQTGLERRETFVDASSISKTYIDENEQEQTYTDAEYRKMILSEGKQELAQLIEVEAFSGEIDITGGVWELNSDYYLGDIVTIQDNKINKYANVRITEITEVQDENGYTVTVNYE